MRKYLYLTLGTLFLIYLFCINSTASEETNLKEIFLSDAPLKWQRYFDFSTRLEGNIQFSRIDKNQNVIEEQITNINNAFPFYTIEVLSKRDNKEIELVKGYNSRYYFSIQKDELHSWKINEVEKYRQHIDLRDYVITLPFQEKPSIKERGLPFLTSHLLGGIELTPLEMLPMVVMLPEFEILSIEEKIIDGTDYVEVTYKHEPTTDQNDVVVGSGKFLLYSDTWLIKTADFSRLSADNRILYHIENEYNFANPEMPIIAKRTKKSTCDGNFRSCEITNYQLHRGYHKNKKRFTLSHYGLPEPDFGESRPNIIRYVIMAIGLLLISLGVWRIYQRKQASG